MTTIVQQLQLEAEAKTKCQADAVAIQRRIIHEMGEAQAGDQDAKARLKHYEELLKTQYKPDIAQFLHHITYDLAKEAAAKRAAAPHKHIPSQAYDDLLQHQDDNEAIKEASHKHLPSQAFHDTLQRQAPTAQILRNLTYDTNPSQPVIPDHWDANVKRMFSNSTNQYLKSLHEAKTMPPPAKLTTEEYLTRRAKRAIDENIRRKARTPKQVAEEWLRDFSILTEADTFLLTGHGARSYFDMFMQDEHLTNKELSIVIGALCYTSSTWDDPNWAIGKIPGRAPLSLAEHMMAENSDNKKLLSLTEYVHNKKSNKRRRMFECSHSPAAAWAQSVRDQSIGK